MKTAISIPDRSFKSPSVWRKSCASRGVTSPISPHRSTPCVKKSTRDLILSSPKRHGASSNVPSRQTRMSKQPGRRRLSSELSLESRPAPNGARPAPGSGRQVLPTQISRVRYQIRIDEAPASIILRASPAKREGSGRADLSFPQILWVAEAPRRMTSGAVVQKSGLVDLRPKAWLPVVSPS